MLTRQGPGNTASLVGAQGLIGTPSRRIPPTSIIPKGEQMGWSSWTDTWDSRLGWHSGKVSLWKGYCRRGEEPSRAQSWGSMVLQELEGCPW